MAAWNAGGEGCTSCEGDRAGARADAARTLWALGSSRTRARPSALQHRGRGARSPGAGKRICQRTAGDAQSAPQPPRELSARAPSCGHWPAGAGPHIPRFSRRTTKGSKSRGEASRRPRRRVRRGDAGSQARSEPAQPQPPASQCKLTRHLASNGSNSDCLRSVSTLSPAAGVTGRDKTLSPILLAQLPAQSHTQSCFSTGKPGKWWLLWRRRLKPVPALLVCAGLPAWLSQEATNSNCRPGVPISRRLSNAEARKDISRTSAVFAGL